MARTKANVKRYEDDETKNGKEKVNRKGYRPLGNREILFEAPPWSTVLLAERKSGEKVVLKIIKKVNKAKLEETTKKKLTAMSRRATDVLTRLHSRRKSKEEQTMEAQAAQEEKVKTKRENEKQIFRIKNETKILKGLNHENIVQYLDGMSYSFETDKKYYIAFAYLKGGRLLDRLEKQSVLTEKQIRNIASSLVKAVYFLHNNPKTQIIHANLRSENVMFASETSYVPVPVLTGFSFARKVDNKEQISIPKIGRYTDVHLVRKEMRRRQQAEETAPSKATKEGDIWSLGVIIHLLLTGRFPFVEAEREADIDDDYLNHVWQDTRKLNTEALYWENVSEDAKAFVIEMLDKSRTNRIMAEKALNHQWIQSKNLPEVHLPGLRERAERMVKEEEEIKRLDRERRARRQAEEEDGDDADEEEEAEVPTRVKTPNKPTSVLEERRSTPQQSEMPARHKPRKHSHYPLEGDIGHQSNDDSDEIIIPRLGTNVNQRAVTPRINGKNTPKTSRTDLTKESKQETTGHRMRHHTRHPRRDTYGLEGGNMSSGSGSGKQDDKKKKKDPTYSLATLEIKRAPAINAQNTNVEVGAGAGRQQKVVHEVNPTSITYASVDSPPSDHHNRDPGSDRFSFVPGLSDNLNVNDDVGDHHSYGHGHGHDGDGYGS